MSDVFSKESLERTLISLDQLDQKYVQLFVVHDEGCVCLAARDFSGRVYVLRYEPEDDNTILSTRKVIRLPAAGDKKQGERRGLWRRVYTFFRKG